MEPSKIDWRLWHLSQGVDFAVRQIKDQIEMLELVMIANSRTPPITEVVEDHTQRALDGLKAAIATLRKAQND